MSHVFTLASVACLGGFFYCTIQCNAAGAIGAFGCSVGCFLFAGGIK